jgi:PhnB protein
MSKLNPYLNFHGTTEEAFNLYKSVFGGEFQAVYRFGDNPGCDGMAAEDKNKIMHIALPVRGSLLMATDVNGNEPFPVNEGNNISLSINADSKVDADELFDKLSEGGTKMIPMSQADWGDYFGMIKDRFGIQWMISFPTKQI